MSLAFINTIYSVPYTVVSVSFNRKSAGMWKPGTDGYLPMQKIQNAATSPDMPYMDDLPSPKGGNQADGPPLPNRPVGKRDSNTSSSR